VELGVGVQLFPPIKTERLILRCVELEDAADIAQLMTPNIGRWLANWPDLFTEEMAAARIVSAREDAWKRRALAFGVNSRVPANRGLIGWVSVERDSQRQRCGHLSFWLGERFQGVGYMAECIDSVIAAGFEYLDLDLIEAGAQVENAASLRTMRGCGMRLAGQRLVYAPARGREELCEFYEVWRPQRVEAAASG
jgi:[ribosomal protein S5]-alanine N-acetyltransferase